VTMRWWDELWLSESLATWFEERLSERRFPDRRLELDALESVHEIMSKDALTSVRRLRQPIAQLDDIKGAFDLITYLKGAALLKMLAGWLGTDVVDRGLGRVLERHRMGTVLSEDLLEEVGRTAGRPLVPVVRPWLDQPGLPLVSVEPRCEGGRTIVRLQQTPYRPLGAGEVGDRRWPIPVCLEVGVSGRVVERCVLFEGAEVDETIAETGCAEWVLPNAGARGYYHWSMPDTSMQALVEAGLAALAPAERLSLADEIEAGVVAGRLELDEALPIAGRLLGDAEPAVGRAAAALPWLLHEHLESPGTQAQVRRWACTVLPTVDAPRLVEARGARRTAPSVAEVARIADRALLCRDPDLRRALARGATDWLEPHPGAAPLVPELVSLGLRIAAEDGGVDLYDRIEAKLGVDQEPIERELLLSALGSFRDARLAARARKYERERRLAPAEVGLVTAAQLGDVRTRGEAWRSLDRSWDLLVRRAGPELAGRWVAWAGVFCDHDQARAVRAMLAPKARALPGAIRGLENALESVERCADVIEHHRSTAERWFAERAPSR